LLDANDDIYKSSHNREGYVYAAVTANCRSVQSVTGYWLLPNGIQGSSRPAKVKENWT